MPTLLCMQCGENERSYSSRYCDTCLEDTAECTACGVRLHLDDMSSCSNCDSYLCEDCRCGSCNYCGGCCDCDGVIQDYSSRNYPCANPSPYTVGPRYLYSGQEGEVECEDNRQTVAGKIQRVFSDEILIKSDGSLHNGFELVTGKLGHTQAKKLWERLAPFAVEAGAKAWKHKNTGFHIHLSRDYFSTLGIGKLMAFINSPCHRSQIVEISGRTCPEYALLEKKKVTDVTKRWGKYVAVNICHAKTVELRIFKGTLSAKRIKVYIDFAFSAARYAQEVMSIEKVDTWAEYTQFLRKNKKEYQDLVNFLDYRQ